MEQNYLVKLIKQTLLQKNKTAQTSTFIISVHFCGFLLFNLVTPSQLLSFPFLPTPRITLNKREFILLLCKLFTRNQCQCGCIFLSMRHITAAQQRLAIKLKFSMWKERILKTILCGTNHLIILAAKESLNQGVQLSSRARTWGAGSIPNNKISK